MLEFNHPKINSLTVLGAGCAGITFLKKLHEKNTAIKLTLIDKNAIYFDKARFTNSLDLKAYIDLKDFARENNVVFIQDTVERINPKQKKIYFKQTEPIDFEALVISSGAKSKSIPLKGERREGLFYLSDINPFEFKGLLKLSSEVIIYATTFLGLKLAILLKLAGKDIRVLGDNWDFLGGSKEKAVNFLNEKQINVHLNVTIEEVIGEGQVKAVKLSPLKVYSCQIVLLDTGFAQNLDFFEELIKITNTRSEFENIFTIGSCAAKDIENDYFYAYNCEEARSQAELLAQFILEGKEINFTPKILSEEDKQRQIEDFLANNKQSSNSNDSATQMTIDS